MNIADAMSSTPISSLDLSRYVTVSPDTSVEATVDTMRAAERSCACVVDDGRVVGIFTQRDILQRVIGRPRTWDTAIAEEMTRRVRTIENTQSVGAGLDIMNDWWVRNVPVTDADGGFVGNLSFWTVMRTISNLLASRIGDTAAASTVSDGLNFVDFTGLNLHPVVTVPAHETVDVAVHHMKNRGIGSILVVDERDHLVGTLTEFDLEMKLGCDHPDLEAVAITDVMDANPNTIPVRSSIADAITTLTEHQDSHVTLVGETNRPAGVASFRDIAAYVETSLEALA